MPEEVKQETPITVPEENKPQPTTFKFDVNTVVFLLYLMYRENLLTRKHLRDMFVIIKQPLPSEDLIKWLVDEGQKGI